MGNSMFKTIFDPVKDPDIVMVDKDNLLFLRAKKHRDEMTGWERIQLIFTRDECGNITPEVHRIKDATLIALFVGGIMGGIGRSRIAYMDFFRRNTITQFETPLQAKKALQDQVTIGMGAGAWRVGWRMSAFTFIYMTGSTLISSYRGKHGIMDQVVGAGTAGFLYKFRDGPKATLAGTIFGSLLGLTAGTLTLAAIKLFDMDMESANMEYYLRLNKKLEIEKERIREMREASNDVPSIQKMHEMFVASMNAKKEVEEDDEDDEEDDKSLEKSSNNVSAQQPTSSEKVESRMQSMQENHVKAT